MFSASFLKTGIVPVAVSLATFSSPFFAKAQSDSLAFKDLLFSKTHISFSLNSNYTKSKLLLTSGTQNLTPVYMPGYECGIDLIFNRNKNIGIKTGLHYGAMIPDYNSALKQLSDGSNSYPSYSCKDWPLIVFPYYNYLSIPLQLEWHTPLNRKTFFMASGGINLRKPLFNFGGFSTDNIGMTVNVFEEAISASYTMRAGLSFVLKNNNLLFVNATATYSNQDLVSGEFYFYSPTRVLSEGTYNNTGSSVGLEFGYRFTQEKNAARIYSKSPHKYSIHRAQLNTKIVRSNLDSIFNHDQLEVNFGVQFNLNPIVKSTKGDLADVHGRNNGCFAINYTFNKDLHWGIKTGAAFGIIQYSYENINYYHYANNENLNESLYNYLASYSFQAAIEYREAIGQNVLFFADAGVDFTKLLAGGLDYGFGLCTLKAKPQNQLAGQVSDKLLPGLNAATGVLFATRNYNMWRLGVEYHHSLSTAANESYVFNKNKSNEQIGTVKVKGDHINFTLGYVYSFARSPYAKARHRYKVDTDIQTRKP